MEWMSIDEMTAQVPLPEGYRFALPQRAEIPGLVCAIKAWLPDISVGGASCYVSNGFFTGKVFLAGEPEKDVLVVLIKRLFYRSSGCSRWMNRWKGEIGRAHV